MPSDECRRAVCRERPHVGGQTDRRTPKRQPRTRRRRLVTGADEPSSFARRAVPFHRCFCEALRFSTLAHALHLLSVMTAARDLRDDSSLAPPASTTQRARTQSHRLDETPAEGGDDDPARPLDILQLAGDWAGEASAAKAPASEGLWAALTAGHLHLVERGASPSRRYLVVESDASSRPARALSPTELEVVALSARGYSTKLVAYTLGVSSSAISRRLATAAAKVGATSRSDLVRLAAILTRDPHRATAANVPLTDAERSVLALLVQGLSNDEIAVRRSRSVRTVANQIASLLRKTQSGSRRELMTHPCSCSAPPSDGRDRG